MGHKPCHHHWESGWHGPGRCALGGIGHATRNVFISILSTSSKGQICRLHLNIPDQVPAACEGKGKGFFNINIIHKILYNIYFNN